MPGDIHKGVQGESDDGGSSGRAGDPPFPVASGTGGTSEGEGSPEKKDGGGPSELAHQPEPIAFRMNGGRLVGKSAVPVGGKQVAEISRSGSQPGQIRRKIQCIPLEQKTEVQGFRLLRFLRARGDRGGGGSHPRFFHAFQGPGSLKEKHRGRQGGTRKKKNADPPVRTPGGQTNRPQNQAEEKYGQSAPGGVCGEAGKGGQDAQEGKNCGCEILSADIRVNRADQKDGGDRQPVGHMVGVGKNPVGLG